MPDKLKPRKTGRVRSAAEPTPELVEALSLAGVKRERIAVLLGLSLPVLDKRYHGHLQCGPKITAGRVAALVLKLVRLAEKAKGTASIPHVMAVVKLLAPVHLEELAAAQKGQDPTPPAIRVEIIGADTDAHG